MQKQGAAGVLAAGVLVLAMSGCSAGSGEPEVTPAPAVASETAVAPAETPTPTVEPAVSVGTREAPLAIGEARKVSEASAWTVALNATNLDAAAAIQAADEHAQAPAAGELFVTGSFTVTVDGAKIAEQGADLANDGASPGQSLTVTYVAADGTSYDGSSGTMCYTPSMLYSQGAVFQDGATVIGDQCVAVPADKVAGGLWRVSNLANESVWFATS
ncbi:hypothetical protein [Cellulomonas triticagri]|uniref:DUF4352 domain-containing protein n=1 Tax=Cellulomonas triticagri TaxID=2483352 RepID=A0A3M2JES7_9CELL|nr:hypothetical protein [Cellulomonas triticagri]RMI12517.1 hypothetical protein EBM89_08385 [Cellulomonas triticagri]